VNWIGSWLEYSAKVESPLLFRTWAGIATLSAALGRRCYTRVKGQVLFPNLYVILVGPPGSGKGNAMKELRYWFEHIDNVHIAPDGLTKRSFYDVLESSHVANPEHPLAFECSLMAYIEELGVFLHAGDNDFIYEICHAYDCPPQFKYKTHGAGENHMERVSFGLVAGVTPRALKEIFSEHAMELGISARTILVFASESVPVDIFGANPRSEQLAKDLQSDLRDISSLRGEYFFDDDAAEEVVSWVTAGQPPVPQDPRFSHYNVRRFVQFIKLCMICAAAKRNELVILQPDVHEAKTVLLEAERYMPRAIESLGANPLLYQQQLAIQYINLKLKIEHSATSEEELRRRLSVDVHPAYMDTLIDQLASARWVECIGEKPNRKFLPRGQREKE
jgi:hypothetical protein